MKEFALTMPIKATGCMFWNSTAAGTPAALSLLEHPGPASPARNVRLHTARGVKRLFFYVGPTAAENSASGSPPTLREKAPHRDVRADGRSIVEEEGDHERPQRVRVRVPAGADGKVWSLALRKPNAAGLNVDDVTLWLEAALPPYLSIREDWALAFGKRTHPEPSGNASIISPTILATANSLERLRRRQFSSFFCLLLILPGTAIGQPPAAVLTKVPFTYILDYGPEPRQFPGVHRADLRRPAHAAPSGERRSLHAQLGSD